MNEKQMLYENYENAFFAIIINEATELDGKRLLEENEQLKRDPSAEISTSFRNRCLDTINKGLKSNKRKATKVTAKKIIRLLPLVAIVAVFLTAIAYAAIPAFRTDVLNLLLEISTEEITWSFKSNEHSTFQPQGQQSFTLDIPDGFYYAQGAVDELSEYVEYRDEQDKYINVTVFKGMDTCTGTDFEDLDYVEEFQIQGNYAVLTVKGDTTSIAWAIPESAFCVYINTNATLSYESMKQIANSFQVTS